ncbi:MAG: beta-lactamase family protein [Acidobacteria bacterium]|nr:beta-lactamase family protein [Acidobacteriota bacterium]MCG2816259.1 beta-lactamase family protein [Candidatus Aminicenantes bacterium]MBU1473764.1 beta-lactamase family protein [Acidobacteriota bacterium]MBU4203284.1 beta-lactamase family protein [Acidobacteriota bacterium]MBU4330141.1 beta-lactamase family protein [Acidobacteriota bacterium]
MSLFTHLSRPVVISLLTGALLTGSAAAQRIPAASPEDVGMSTARLAQVRPVILEGVEKRAFPGAVLVVVRKGRLVWKEAYGYSWWSPVEKKMEVNHVFDLASITKPVATSTSLLLLVERGRIRLWDKVSDFVPEFTAFTGKDGRPGADVRIWHLITHTSGLPAYTEGDEVEKRFGVSCTREELVRYIAGLTKLNPPGEVFRYSCLGYITLAVIIERISGKNLALFAEENIFRPLGMQRTGFNPPPDLLPLCVPTEYWKHSPLVGVVHDPLARLQGGISGNAGLFSDAEDLAVYAQMILNRGVFRGVRILSPLTVERMTEIYPQTAFSGRGLGWDLDSSYSTNGGDLFGPEGYGHTGYTGTSVWIDPETETVVVLMTNRVHPDDRGSVVSLRSRVANVVAAAIVDR